MHWQEGVAAVVPPRHSGGARSSAHLPPLQNARAGGPAQGALFWTWYASGQRAPAEEGGSADGLYGGARGGEHGGRRVVGLCC